MIDKYEDPFVRIASMIGGDEYLKVARSLLKAEDATDEEIASSTGLRINMVRKVLYDLFGKSLITGIRVKDERKGWFVYRWSTRREEVEHFIENQKISNDSLRKNFEKILTLIMPILPHFASECLTMLNSKLNLENISWPVYDKASIEDSDCNIVIQINGKKRSLIRLPINSNESFVVEKAKLESNVKKYLINNNVKKQIYVKNRLINFII